MSKIPIFGDAAMSFFSIQPMHHNYSPLLLLLLLLFHHPMECQPTPPLDKMDRDTVVEETNNKSSSVSSSTSSNSSTSLSNSSLLDENSSATEDEQQTMDEQPLTQYHAKNYFNSTMGGKDLRLLFAMAIACNSHELPDHKDPPFSKAKAYHSEVKPDAATLKLEVTQRYQAYICKGHQPCPSNWKIDKCIEYLMSNPIPMSQKGTWIFYSLNWKNGKASNAW